MIAAAKRAEAHEFIERLVDAKGRRGYDAHVGERGVKLCGGQRQRIAIARVMLKDAPILLLDEATSALDSEVENAIQQSLYRLMEGKTVVAIAHRLSTIAAMDRLIVMDKGRIVEEGNHREAARAGRPVRPAVGTPERRVPRRGRRRPGCRCRRDARAHHERGLTHRNRRPRMQRLLPILILGTFVTFHPARAWAPTTSRPSSRISTPTAAHRIRSVQRSAAMRPPHASGPTIRPLQWPHARRHCSSSSSACVQCPQPASPTKTR